MKTTVGRIAACIDRGKVAVVAAWVVLGIAGLTSALTLGIDNDVLHWVDADGDLGKLPNYINERFGQTNPVIVLVTPERPWSKEGLGLLVRITERLSAREDAQEVLSLGNAASIGTSEWGDVDIGDFLPDALPESPEAYEALKARALGDASFNQRLVSADGGTFSVILKPGPGFRVDETARLVREDLEAYCQDERVRLRFSGVPSLMNEVSRIVSSDLAALVPAVLAVIAVVLLASLRSVRSMIPALVAAILPVAIALGAHAALGGSLNAMSVAVPVILVAVGSAYGIHAIADRKEHAGEDEHRIARERIAASYSRIGMPVLLSGLTTVGGFASLGGADISVVRDFGYLCAAGVAVSIACALTLVPALLAFKPFAPRSVTGSRESGEPGKVASLLARAASRKAPLVAVSFAAVAAIALAFATRLESRVDYLSYFTPESEPREAARAITEGFGGYSPAQIYAKADMKEPIALKALLVADERAFSLPGTPPATGYAHIISKLNGVFTGVYSIPERRDELESLDFLLEGRHELSSFVTEARDEGLSTFMIPTLDSVYYERLSNEVGQWSRALSSGVVAREVSLDDRGFATIAKLFLGNAIAAAGLGDGLGSRRPDENELDRIYAKIVTGISSIRPFYDTGAIERYLASDECELPLDPDAAAMIASEARAAKASGPEDFLRCVTGASTLMGFDAPNEDAEGVAWSLAAREREYVASSRVEVARAALAESIGAQEANSERVSLALAPFAWSTFPSPASADEPSLPISLTLTGLSTLMDGMRKGLLESQLVSLAIALLAVGVINSFAFRSAAKGLASLAPIAVTIAVNFGVMGALGIKLDMITIAIASISIGTGVDFTLHVASRVSREMAAADRERAFARALSGVGKAIAGNALSVGAGFAVLAFSSVMPLRTLGLMLALTMAVSSISACALAPATLALLSFRRQAAGKKADSDRPTEGDGARDVSSEETGTAHA